MKYETDIKLGERYRDAQTGIEGTAIAVCFYQHGCERVTLETVTFGAGGGREIKEYAFDSPRLTHAATGEQAKTTRTGGPRDAVAPRAGLAR